MQARRTVNGKDRMGRPSRSLSDAGPVAPLRRFGQHSRRGRPSSARHVLVRDPPETAPMDIAGTRQTWTAENHLALECIEGPFPPHAPLIVGSPEIRDLFSRERSISPALRAAASCDLALLGIGTLGEEASLVRYGHHDRDCSELLPLDGYRALVETLERDSAVGSKEAAAEIADRAVDCEALGRVPIVVEQPRAVAKSVHSRRFNVLSKAARLVTLWRPDREPRSSPARTVRRRTR